MTVCRCRRERFWQIGAHHHIDVYTDINHDVNSTTGDVQNLSFLQRIFIFSLHIFQTGDTRLNTILWITREKNVQTICRNILILDSRYGYSPMVTWMMSGLCVFHNCDRTAAFCLQNFAVLTEGPSKNKNLTFWNISTLCQFYLVTSNQVVPELTFFIITCKIIAKVWNVPYNFPLHRLNNAVVHFIKSPLGLSP